MKAIHKLPAAPVKKFTASISLQETISFNYELKRISLYLVAENILNEMFKPDPVVDGSGFHYGANPTMEMDETRGTTGFIKLGLTINLRFN